MDYFPLGLASGQAFCNRENEQQKLLYNIKESRPTLIASPRRYGKTSLSLHVIGRSRLKFAQFDFFPAINEGDIEQIIFKGVGELISRLEKTPTKMLKVATDFFSGLSIKLALDKVGLQVEISQHSTKPASTILDILKRLDKLSAKYKHKVVLLFDEFQRLYQITEDQSIEGAIRQIAQASQNLSFIFSGSNRHLLQKIFDDRNRPFYKLCDKIALERIQPNEYMKYLRRAAKNTSNLTIIAPSFERILLHTERHPYYVNLLCSRLWSAPKITEAVVDEAWRNYCFEERSQVANELDLLSNSQRKLLIILARCDGTNAPRSSEFERLAGMPGATISQALRFLEQKDYVVKNNNGYITILDPLIKDVIKYYST